MKRLAPLFLILLVVPCCAMDTSEEPTEQTGETEEDLSSSPSKTPPTWTAHREGKDTYILDSHYLGDPGKGEFFYNYPPDADAAGSVVLLRTSAPRLRIQLNLTVHWMLGDAYFVQLMEENKLTALDLVSILGALHDLLAADPEVHAHPAPTPRGRAFFFSDDGEPGGQPVDPFPWFPSGPPNAGGTSAPPSVPLPPPWGRPPKGSGPTNDYVHNPKWVSDFQKGWNGLRQGDPPPKPSPMAGHYKPKPGEQREVFKCEGNVFLGYKRGCIDFQEGPITEKWVAKLTGFWKKYDRGLWLAVRHALWNDGKNPGCNTNCLAFSASMCATEAILIGAICDLVTNGACTVARLASYQGGIATSAVFGVCTDVLKTRCTKNECEP